MDDRDKELLATYRAEAAAFFTVNQAQRSAAERSLALLFTVIAVAVGAGIGAETADVVLPVPAAALLIFAYMCNQYSDLTVLGMARALIEERVSAILREDALMYEIAVAPVRKHRPLSIAVRLLQWLSAALVLALILAGAIVAVDDQPAWVTVAYCVVTAASLVVAVVAYRVMLATPEVAAREIADTLAARARRRAEDDAD